MGLSSLRRVAVSALAFILVLSSVGLSATPAAAQAGKISGRVVDSATLQPIQDVCVFLGIPGNFCIWKTDVNGAFSADLDSFASRDGLQWEVYFVKTGYVTTHTAKFVSQGGYTFGQDALVPNPFPLTKAIVPSACATTATGGLPALAATVFLPNITRNLGGLGGWYTPFIIQNVGASNATLEVSFYKFSDGTCVARSLISNVVPGTSYSNDPRDNVKNSTLPDDTQFSVVVRSFGSAAVGVVNEHMGTGDRAEAMSYDGFTSGAKTVYLPNITRKFFGLFDTPFIIQNLGTAPATVASTFRSFDGTGAPVTIMRTIAVGGAKPIDPDSDDRTLGAPGLTDNKQYAVTVSSDQDVAVVVNTQADGPSVAKPIAAATDGITTGAQTVYGAYSAKNAQGVGRYSTIVVQNLATTTVRPVVTFTPLPGTAGSSKMYTFPSINSNSSKAFDPRITFSTQGTSNVFCVGAEPDCLPDGEYSITIDGGVGASIAAQVNVYTASTAMGYSATATPALKFFLPNVTKSLCFCPSPTRTDGWSTPIIVQSVTATALTLKWYRFTDGGLATTQTMNITAGTAVRVDPWDVAGLAADRQYSVVVDGGVGTITAIVTEFGPGGDNAMIYEGFAAP
ncbi:MAG: hypothetical protein M3R37_13725 [Actinomycetota bacterium]|nr:hypothetical protein [Actinomycetota bacterium]